jgi:hypothetical protein
MRRATRRKYRERKNKTRDFRSDESPAFATALDE